MSSVFSSVFMTGGTGYIGQRLIPELLRRGHSVRALVRNGSEKRLPPGTIAVPGDALDTSTFANRVAPSDTFVQLVGVAHPSPAKKDDFRKIDFVSVRESVNAARDAGVKHFVYLSVAQPAPIMRDYIAVRAEGEAMIRSLNTSATFIRPWYVLGPGHRWPYFVLPLYWLWMLKSPDTARRLYPVKLASVIRAMANAIDAPPKGVRIIEAPEMRRA
jgi:uncharacterized protein YbjT (DUF2867 family)